MNKVTEKKQIKLDVKNRIERGEPKQQILEELSHLYKNKVTLVRQIEITPSKATRAKYAKYNYLLAFLLSAALVLDVILVLATDKSLGTGNTVIIVNNIISIILDLIFIVGVLSFHIPIYGWIASRALFTLLTIIVSSGYFHVAIHPVIYLSLSFIIVSFMLGLWLGIKKLCPPRIPKIIEIDVDGLEKIKKTILVYPD